MDLKNKNIIDFIKENPSSSSKEIHDGISSKIGYATVKRILTKLLEEKLIITKGKGKGTKYLLSPSYELLFPINLDTYFEKEIDDRIIKESFDLQLIKGPLNKVELFSSEEIEFLENLQNQYKKNISTLTESGYKKELERLAIDLSWKS